MLANRYPIAQSVAANTSVAGVQRRPWCGPGAL